MVAWAQQLHRNKICSLTWQAENFQNFILPLRDVWCWPLCYTPILHLKHAEPGFSGLSLHECCHLFCQGTFNSTATRASPGMVSYSATFRVRSQTCVNIGIVRTVTIQVVNSLTSSSNNVLAWGQGILAIALWMSSAKYPLKGLASDSCHCVCKANSTLGTSKLSAFLTARTSRKTAKTFCPKLELRLFNPSADDMTPWNQGRKSCRSMDTPFVEFVIWVWTACTLMHSSVEILYRIRNASRKLK